MKLLPMKPQPPVTRTVVMGILSPVGRRRRAALSYTAEGASETRPLCFAQGAGKLGLPAVAFFRHTCRSASAPEGRHGTSHAAPPGLHSGVVVAGPGADAPGYIMPPLRG